MNKCILSLVFGLCVVFIANAQQSAILWQKTFGGSNEDVAYALLQTADSGYIVAGRTYSIDQDVTVRDHLSSTKSDCWVIKLNKTGGIVWQKTYGGSNNETIFSIKQIPSGYLLAGRTESVDGISGGNFGRVDVLVMKLDNLGNRIGSVHYGGEGDDTTYDIQPTQDGAYIFAAQSFSTGGQVNQNHDSRFGPRNDFWIAKISSDLTAFINRKVLGGAGQDYAKSILQTADGGYIVAGFTDSKDGDVRGFHGQTELSGLYDYWIIKLDAALAITKQITLGGSNIEEEPVLQQTKDGGYIVAGSSNSTDGDVKGNHGNYDYWVVKLTANLDTVWTKSIGGSGREEATAIQQTADGGYIVAGNSTSNDKDAANSGYHGANDIWVVKLDSMGNIQRQKALGGTGSDYVSAIQQTPDGNYILTGRTSSNNGDISFNHGDNDVWVAKIDLCSIKSAQINGDAVVCLGNTITLTGVGGGTYKWSNGATTPTINVAQAGQYSVTVKDSSGCVFTANKTVALSTVTPVISGNTTFCAGDSTTLTASGGTKYEWLKGDTTTTFKVKFSGTYTVIVTNTFGCKAEISKIVTVNPLPTVTLTSSKDSCTSVNTSLTATGGGTYTWSNSLGTTPSVLLTESGKYTVTVTGTNGCKTTATKNISLITQPIITNDRNQSVLDTLPICTGETIILEAKTPEGLRPTWSTGETTPKITVSTSGTYSATVTNAAGCKGIAKKIVVVNPLPIANFVPKDIFCGNNDTLTATGGGSYRWSSGETTASIPIKFAISYTVTVTDINGCSASKTKNISNINPKPTAQFTVGTIAGGNVPLTNTSSLADTYRWDFGNGSTSIIANPTLVYTVTGTYAITLRANTTAGCIDSTKRSVTITKVATQDLPEGLKVQLSPNPTSGLLNVNLTFNRPFKDNEQLKMTDLLGRQVVELNQIQASNPLDMSHLPNGTYLLHLILNEGIYTLEKIVKQE